MIKETRLVGNLDTGMRFYVKRKMSVCWTLPVCFQESIIEHSTSEEKGPDKDIGRVGGWAADFDKLLRDPAGLQTFAEFLRKEFSHENIFFWCACERYRRLEAGPERLRLAQDIVRNRTWLPAFNSTTAWYFLFTGVAEPVRFWPAVGFFFTGSSFYTMYRLLIKKNFFYNILLSLIEKNHLILSICFLNSL